ncbi:hypothetical protein A2755_01615 [Candidatus Wolfebacteria bacterium RIFCSPHIGHO2_01_FULL_48_22]|uniref:VTT domain-containing protein n=2 Tax=Candidatus Wolfeibacteriota TaxID=1752735 RepID=A0A1F8DQJ8_9BACT|nr:MAG: hypothetical protein A2755_01615 [Candidatus Wolfebacteria bacterium RIFCSPHIGHO2_01_FULL_48_22]OGM91935.1 MAG: hypothetical protein A2935_02255 [Candidatus Wolfebacteria bacterium RIFCSPLOWO2_01_FULL_47_17b]
MSLIFSDPSFQGIVQFFVDHSYIIMFIVFVFEGPIALMAASFGASLGYFNIWIVIGLAILGDDAGDFLWFYIGYLGRNTIVKKFGRFFGVSEERIERLKSFLEKHPKKTVTFIKLSPVISVVGLMIVGSTHMSFKKFLYAITPIIIIKTAGFVLLGYFFGAAYNTILYYYKNVTYGILLVGLLIIATYIIFKRFEKRLAHKLEKNGV